MFNGTPGHGIVQVYNRVLKESGLYEQAEVEGKEADVEESFKAVWKSLNEFRDGKSILYPTGLLGCCNDHSEEAFRWGKKRLQLIKVKKAHHQ